MYIRDRALYTLYTVDAKVNKFLVCMQMHFSTGKIPSTKREDATLVTHC